METGLVGRSWADYLLVGLIASESHKHIQTGATMDAVYEIKQDASQNSPVSGGDSGAIDVSLDQDWGNW